MSARSATATKPRPLQSFSEQDLFTLRLDALGRWVGDTGWIDVETQRALNDVNLEYELRKQEAQKRIKQRRK